MKSPVATDALSTATTCAYAEMAWPYVISPYRAVVTRGTVASLSIRTAPPETSVQPGALNDAFARSEPSARL